jgi:hypothetical protein
MDGGAGLGGGAGDQRRARARLARQEGGGMKQLTMIAALLAIGAAPLVHAQQDAPVPTVLVNGVRDPAMMPYEDAYKSLTKIGKVGNGKMDLAIRIVSAHDMQPMPDLEISLQGENNFEKLVISADGFLTVPLSQERVDDKAVFLTNKKKGSVKTLFFFVPKLPAQQVRYADIAASIAAARRARAQLLPWYARLVMAHIEIVSICYPDDKQVIAVSNGVTRAANAQKKSLLNKETLYCAAFSRAETEAAGASVLAMAPGWTPFFN